MNHKKKQSTAKSLIDSLLDQSQSGVGSAEIISDVTDIGHISKIEDAERDITLIDNDKTIDFSTSDLSSNKTQVLSAPEYPKPTDATNIADRIDPTFKDAKRKEAAKPSNFLDIFRRESKVSGNRGGFDSSPVADHKLGQAEHLRIAQERILELEADTERLRSENEQLQSAGEAMKRRADEMSSRAEKLEINLREEIETGKQERQILKESISSKKEDVSKLSQKNSELELRLESDLKKIRVRERELENRLEIVKMEEAALLRNKDDIILDMQRRVDQLVSETENHRSKSQDLHRQVEGEQDRLRRTVRALRLALSLLEDGDIKDSLRKVG